MPRLGHCLIDGSRHGVVSALLDRGARVMGKETVTSNLAAGAAANTAGALQQALDHELRSRNDGSAQVLPRRIDEVDGHRGADVDDAHRAVWGSLVSGNDGDKPIDPEPPRL